MTQHVELKPREVGMRRPRNDAATAEFTAWVAARHAALHRTAYLLCAGDAHNADDLTQATLAKLYLAWGRVQDRSQIDAYARRIMVNEHRSTWRRAWKRREVVSDQLPERGIAGLEYDGQGDAVWQLVQTLPPKQRAVVVLRYYDDLSEAEIAAALGISPGTVKSQASRALASLRQRVPDHPAIDDPHSETPGDRREAR
jgi:RNA polymerase sigma-70 factor (sigma-E family)